MNATGEESNHRVMSSGQERPRLLPPVDPRMYRALKNSTPSPLHPLPAPALLSIWQMARKTERAEVDPGADRPRVGILSVHLLEDIGSALRRRSMVPVAGETVQVPLFSDRRRWGRGESSDAGGSQGVNIIFPQEYPMTARAEEVVIAFSHIVSFTCGRQ